MPEIDMAWALFELAEQDARAAEALMSLETVPRRIIGFHAQQAVEKALKAWLILLDVDYPLTHSIYTLLSLVNRAGKDSTAFSELQALTPYAIELRYAQSDVTGQADPAELMPVATELLAYVRELLEAQAKS